MAVLPTLCSKPYAAATAVFAACLIVSGCGAGNDMFPLKVGQEWTYRVSNTFLDRVQTLRVSRRIPVAQGSGYELTGPMGISRVAWQGATLYAEVLPNTRVYPPVPILIANDATGTAHWKGHIERSGKTFPAEAVLQQRPDTVDVGTKRYDCTDTVLSFKFDGQDIELETWFSKGIGPIQQDHRTNGKLDYRVLLLEAPH